MAQNIGAKGEEEWIEGVDLIDCLAVEWETKSETLLALYGSFRVLYRSLGKLQSQVREIGIEGKTTVVFRELVRRELKTHMAISALLMP